MVGIAQFGIAFADYLLHKNLQHLIVHVTNHCNFRCSHCFIDFSPKRDLKLESYEALGKQAGKLFWLDIGGGEPFLRKDLAEIVSCFDTRVVTIPSNGALPDQMEEQFERMHALSGAELVVSLSLDGLQETHDRIRNHPGSWDQVWSTFERLRRFDWLSVKVNTVLNRDNEAEILELMREVRRRGPDFHSIILLRGDPADRTMGLPPLQRLHDLGPKIYSILETYNYGRNPVSSHILRNYHRTLWNVSLRTLEERRQILPCAAGKAHMVVMGDGSVSSCEMLPTVGNIKTQSLDEIRRSDEFRKQVGSIENNECHCTHNCAMFDTIFFNPSSVPHLLGSKVDV